MKLVIIYPKSGCSEDLSVPSPSNSDPWLEASPAALYPGGHKLFNRGLGSCPSFGNGKPCMVVASSGQPIRGSFILFVGLFSEEGENLAFLVNWRVPESSWYLF